MYNLLVRRLGSRVTVARRFYTEGSSKPPSAPSRTSAEEAIHDKLQSKFSPSQLLVQDVSGGCGDFYAITISSEAFRGLPTLKQHRLVQDALKEEIGSMHGVQLKTIPT